MRDDRGKTPWDIVSAIVDRIDEAWRQEGHVPPDVLCLRAQYTNLSGQLFSGRDAIVEGTRAVKATFQTEVMDRSIIDVEELVPGVIAANVASSARVSFPDRQRDVRGRQFYLIVQEDGAWRIAVYYNTPFSP